MALRATTSSFDDPNDQRLATVMVADDAKATAAVARLAKSAKAAGTALATAAVLAVPRGPARAAARLAGVDRQKHAGRHGDARRARGPARVAA